MPGRYGGTRHRPAELCRDRPRDQAAREPLGVLDQTATRRSGWHALAHTRVREFPRIAPARRMPCAPGYELAAASARDGPGRGRVGRCGMQQQQQQQSNGTPDGGAPGPSDDGGCGACPATCLSFPDSPECECESEGGVWNNGGCFLPEPDAASPDAVAPDGGPTDAGPGDAALDGSSGSLQCGGGPFSGAGTDPCTNAGGVCVQLPDSSCCDLVPGFDPTNSGCPHAAFAIRCCALGGDAGKATDASAE